MYLYNLIKTFFIKLKGEVETKPDLTDSGLTMTGELKVQDTEEPICTGTKNKKEYTRW